MTPPCHLTFHMVNSEQLLLLRNSQADQYEHKDGTKNPKEPSEAGRVPPRHWHVHTEQTADQIERHKNGCQNGDLAKRLVDVVTLRDIVDLNLRQVVAVASAEHLFKVRQITHHGDNVILNVAEIEADIATRRHIELFVAAFREAFDDVGFAAEEAEESHDGLTAITNGAEYLA